MKRIRSMGLSVCAILLAAVMFFGSGSIVFAKADAGDPVPPTAPVTEFFQGKIVSEVELGETFVVPATQGNATVVVKAPNGQHIELEASREVVASQLGNYTIEASFAGSKSTYTYNVFCSMTNEYSVFVEYDGAKIPTFMAKGDSFYVPDVFLGHYDDDGELVRKDIDGGDINGFTVSVTEVGKKEVDADGKLKIKAEKHGTMILRYSISLSEGKYYSKEYSITVQNNFTNTSAPKLNVVNVPTTANINTKVTLPIATATSSFDERVYVKVTVTHGGEEVVKITNIDKETGYALPLGNETEPVVFDNVRDMSFYPTKLGTYNVSYQAIDTAGNESTPHFYSIECTDGLAPVFVDFDRHEIPTKWGLSVRNGVNSEPVDTSFTLPMPEVVDNYDSRDKLSVSLRIIDHKSRVVLRFTNILNATEGQTGTGHKASNVLYDGGAEQVFGENGFEFDFGKYTADDKIGTYTVEYRVSDSKNKTRTYSPAISVELVRSFEDTTAPTIDPIDPVRYILLGETEELEIPKVVVSDDNDSHTKIDYSISFLKDGETDATAPYAVDDVDKLEIVSKEVEGATKYFLEDNGTEVFEISDGVLKLSCSATDDAGNVSTFTVINNGNEQTVYAQEAEIRVYSSQSQSPVLDTDFDLASATISRNADPEVNLGNFKISGVDVRFAGFEVLLKNPNNGIANVSLERMMIGDTIYVKNLTFTAVFSGDHDLFIRVFDVTGESTVYRFTKNITIEGGSTGPYAVPASAIIPETGSSQNTRYSLRSIPNPNDATSVSMAVLRVSGGSFSLIGYDFIANSTGGFNFVETSIAATELDAANNYDYINAEPNFDKTHLQYSTIVNATDTPVIEILGNVPAYSAKYPNLKETERFDHNTTGIEEAGWVVLPSVSAFNRTNNVEVRIKITDRDGNTVNEYKVYENKDGDLAFFEEGNVDPDYFFTNRWAFAPTSDGAITVTYEAVWNGSTRASSVHTILVGKITVPVVTLNELPRNSYTIGTTYNFFTVKEVLDDEGITTSEIGRYTLSKRLIDPSGTTVVNISGTVDKYKDVKDNDGKDIVLEKSGTYTEIYEVTDLYGNKTTIKRDFQVTAKSRTASASMKMLSTILIIVAVLLLAGVVFYIIRFRTVKKIKR